MAGQLRYELVGDASQFAGAAGEVSDAADLIETDLAGLQGTIDELTAGQLRYNEAAEQFRGASGEFVSGAEAQAAVLQELNALGIKTEEQYEAQISHLSTLAEAVEEGTLAHQQLAQMQDRLQREMLQTAEASEAAGRGMNAAAGPGAELGFIMQDMQQFQFGVAEGLRAVTNNIPGVIQGFQRAAGSGMSLTSVLTGTGGILIGVNAVAGALPFLVDWLTETEEAAQGVADQADEMGSSLDDLASRVIEIQGQTDQTIPIPAGQLERAAGIMEQRVQALEQIINTLPDEGAGIIPTREFERLGPLAQTLARRISESTEGLTIAREEVEKRLEASEAISGELGAQLERQRQLRRLARQLNLNTASQAEMLVEAEQKVTDLRDELELLNSAEGERLIRLERQAEALERQRDLQRWLIRARQEGTLEDPVPGGTQQVPVGGLQNAPGGFVSEEGELQNLGQLEIQELQNVMQETEDSAHRVATALGQGAGSFLRLVRQSKVELEDVAGLLFRGVGSLLASQASGGTAAFLQGVIGSFRHGGLVQGPGTGESDSILARLSDGEFVVNAASAERAQGLLQTINADPSMAGFAQSMLATGWTGENGAELAQAPRQPPLP